MTASVAGVFGSGSAAFGLEGNLSCQASAGINPAAIAADKVLAVYSLPANSLDQSGRSIQIAAAGNFGATDNNKRVKIIVNPASAVVGATVGAGGTALADTGTVVTNAAGWQLSANICKYGAAGSNTQIGINSNNSGAALLAPAALTLFENAAIVIAVTGNATTDVTDIALNLFTVKAAN